MSIEQKNIVITSAVRTAIGSFKGSLKNIPANELGSIVLYRIDPATGEKVVLNDALGTVDYVEGEIKLYDVTIVMGSFFDNRIQVRVQPDSNDVNAERSLYLDVDISNSKFTVYPE